MEYKVRLSGSRCHEEFNLNTCLLKAWSLAGEANEIWLDHEGLR